MERKYKAIIELKLVGDIHSKKDLKLFLDDMIENESIVNAYSFMEWNIEKVEIEKLKDI